MLQLKTSVVLSPLKRPFREGLELAARMGVSAVEIDARNELRPAELSQTGLRQIRKWLSDYNLSVSCIQFPTNRGFDTPERLEQRIEGTKAAMQMASSLGCRIVSNRIGTIPTDDGDPRWEFLLPALHDLAAFSLKAGAWLALRTGPDSGESLGQFLARFPAGALLVDFDPASLMLQGHSPDEVMKQVGAAVGNFRARDAVRDFSRSSVVEVQLGRGTVDFGNLLGMLEEHQYRGYLAVESQHPTDAVTECAQAIEYLQNLFA
ncbi:MAG: sugar phosphate isomerase/epimerase [Pirellulaceae bacterium]|nr:sugar phosphate isomerase/epimerase [Pirellulaceae bacterium]